MANIENLLTRRFIHTTEKKWTSLSTEAQKQYDNSIVFIKSSTEGIGYAIYTQGHTFYTDDVTADNLLAKLKAGDNISLDIVEEGGVRKVQITGTAYTLSTTAVDNGAKLTFTGSVNGKDGKPLSVNEFSIVGSGDAKVTVEGSTVTIDAVEYKGQNAIEIAKEVVDSKETGDKLVTLKIDSTDKFLSQSTSGLKADIEVAYDSTTNYLYLKGRTVDGKALTTTGFDASAFVKDSFLESAAFVTISGGKDGEVETGKADGEYLKLVFNIVDTDTDPEKVNSTNTVYLPVGDLVKTGTMDFKGDTKEFTFDPTVGKYVDGANLADALNELDADLDATLAEGTTKDANEVVVVTGLTQTNGLITSVDSAVVVNKTYVDEAITNAEGALSLENGENASYVFGIKNGENEDQDGYVNASEVAAILNAAWAWGEIK